MTTSTKTINCLNCGLIVTRRTPKHNNVKFCSPRCRSVYSYQKNKTKHTAYNRSRLAYYAPGKIKCLVCEGYYRRPASHAHAVHGLPAYEYKRLHDLDTTKGILHEDTRQRLKYHLSNNPHIIVSNLITKGTQTRFKKGDRSLGTYERNAKQKERLRKHAQTIRPKSKKINTL